MVGVKGLIDAGIRLVPDEYFFLQDSRPCSDALGEQIPVIDILDLGDPSRKQQILEAVRVAAEEWGFFQVKLLFLLFPDALLQLLGHGFPVELMNSMLQVVHGFFQLPAEERSIFYSEAASKKFKLGTSFNPSAEKRLLWQDHLFQMCYPSSPSDDELPSKPSSFRTVSREYAKRMNQLAKLLLSLFSESLGLEAGVLEQAMQGERHAMRMNYYPPCPHPDRAIGLASHSDPNTFTILQQDPSVEGLQVMHRGRWVSVKPLHGALVVNVADQLQILTNGRYKSVEHRAMVNFECTRVSIASFYGPGEEASIEPLSQLLDKDRPPLYRKSCYGDYLRGFYSGLLHGKAALNALEVEL